MILLDWKSGQWMQVAVAAKYIQNREGTREWCLILAIGRDRNMIAMRCSFTGCFVLESFVVWIKLVRFYVWLLSTKMFSTTYGASMNDVEFFEKIGTARHKIRVSTSFMAGALLTVL